MTPALCHAFSAPGRLTAEVKVLAKQVGDKGEAEVAKPGHAQQVHGDAGNPADPAQADAYQQFHADHAADQAKRDCQNQGIGLPGYALP